MVKNLYVRFEPTEDERIVIGIKEIREKIHLDKLLGQIQELEEKINELVPIEIPPTLPSEVRSILEDQADMIEVERERLLEEKAKLEFLVEELRANGYNV